MAYIGRQPSYGAFEKEPLTPDGSTTTFTLSYQVGSSAAVLVSRPKSINSAANEKTPSGTLIKPDAIPLAKDEYQDRSLSLSASLSGRNSSAI